MVWVAENESNPASIPLRADAHLLAWPAGSGSPLRPAPFKPAKASLCTIRLRVAPLLSTLLVSVPMPTLPYPRAQAGVVQTVPDLIIDTLSASLSRSQNSAFNINYVIGAVEGKIYYDTVKVGSRTIPRQGECAVRLDDPQSSGAGS